MTGRQIAQDVIAALCRAGFSVSRGQGTLTFRGEIHAATFSVKVRIEYEDLEFHRTPQVFIEDTEALPRRVFPHINEWGELCVVDRTTYVADRYLAPGQALGIVARARELLTAGATKSATKEIGREFPEHWGGLPFGMNMEPKGGLVFCQEGRDGYEFVRQSEARGASSIPVLIAETTVELSFLPDQRRPETLGQVLEWARSWDPGLRDRILDGLCSQLPIVGFCIISAPNGIVGFTFKPAGIAKSLQRGKAARRMLETPLWLGLGISRLRGRRTDLPYVLGRSFGGRAPLTDKNVVLVGCGCIGGFTSVALSRLGAGLGKGKLSIVDPEILNHSNIARHILGEDAVGKTKAESCRDLILRNTPGLTVVAHPFKIEERRHLCAGADLVIDATGEEGIGEMLNAWRLEAARVGDPWASLLHACVCGHGAAVQSFFSSDSEFACYRCLHPKHDELPRYWPVKPGLAFGPVDSCGDSTFTPHGISAPMMAASLVSAHAVDWAGGNPRKLLRTHVVDEKQANMVKAVNPPKTPRCPACGERSDGHRSSSDSPNGVVGAD